MLFSLLGWWIQRKFEIKKFPLNSYFSPSILLPSWQVPGNSRHDYNVVVSYAAIILMKSRQSSLSDGVNWSICNSGRVLCYRKHLRVSIRLSIHIDIRNSYLLFLNSFLPYSYKGSVSFKHSFFLSSLQALLYHWDWYGTITIIKYM